MAVAWPKHVTGRVIEVHGSELPLPDTQTRSPSCTSRRQSSMASRLSMAARFNVAGGADTRADASNAAHLTRVFPTSRIAS